MRLNRLAGERFWSGVVEDGERMPYAEGDGFDTVTSVIDNQIAPLLLSSHGAHAWAEGDVAATFEADGVTLAGDVRTGRSGDTLRSAFLAASAAHFPPAGVAPPPAMFSAPQYNTWIELVYDQRQERILEYARGLVKHGYPPGVLMIDDNWQEDYGVWRFHPERFPDPAAMVAELHQLGFTVMLWVCPFLSPDSATFRAAEHLVLRVDGEVAIRNWWNGYSAVLDLTKPEAVAWFHGQLRGLRRDLGIDGFKFDAGDQRFYPEDANAHCASYAAFGESYAFNEFRSGWGGGGKALAQRLTDALPLWGARGLGTLIPRGLAQGLAGYAFTCPDMVGGGMASSFEEDGFALDEELFVRWAQCSVLFPMTQFSLAPWRVLGPENAARVLAAVEIRQRHVPYLLELAGHAARSGEPIMRHLEYVHPHLGYHGVTDQFLLGADLLVAPVLERGARSRRVVFPPGTWDGDDGSTITGPAEQVVAASLDRLPHYLRRPA